MKKLRFGPCPRITRTPGPHEGLSLSPSGGADFSGAIRAGSYFCPLEGDCGVQHCLHGHVQCPSRTCSQEACLGIQRPLFVFTTFSSLLGHLQLWTAPVLCQMFFCVNAEQPFLKRTIEGKGFLPGSKQTPPGGAGSSPVAAMEPERVLAGSSLPVPAPCDGHGASGSGLHRATSQNPSALTARGLGRDR